MTVQNKKGQVRVDFFGEEILVPQTHGSVFAILGAIKNGQIPLKAVQVGEHRYELREVERVGPAYQGVIGKFRQTNLPVIGRLGTPLAASDEHAIPMDDDEGLIEKTHFVLYGRPPLLLMQLNRDGPGVNTLARYLAEVSQERLSFAPVLRREAYERMLSGNMHARKISLKIARPRGVDLFKQAIEDNKDTEFLKEILHLMNSNRAAAITLTLQSDMKKKDPRKSLNGSIKARMAAVFNYFAGDDMLEKAQLDMVNEHGEMHPVDLIEDRLFTKISVEKEGRYPNKTAIFREMMRSKDEAREEWRAFFQSNDS